MLEVLSNTVQSNVGQSTDVNLSKGALPYSRQRNAQKKLSSHNNCVYSKARISSLWLNLERLCLTESNSDFILDNDQADQDASAVSSCASSCFR
jgi:hypothetical protein